MGEIGDDLKSAKVEGGWRLRIVGVVDRLNVAIKRESSALYAYRLEDVHPRLVVRLVPRAQLELAILVRP